MPRRRASLKCTLTKTELPCLFPISTRRSSGTKTSDDRVITVRKPRLAQLAIDALGDVERHDFLRRSVAPMRTGILAAVTGVDHDGGECPAGIFARDAAAASAAREDRATSGEQDERERAALATKSDARLRRTE